MMPVASTRHITAPAERAISYLPANAPGSVRGVAFSIGSRTASTAYTAFGALETTGGLTSEIPFGFAEGDMDPTGLVYLIDRESQCLRRKATRD